MLPQLWCLKQRKLYSLRVLEAGSPKSLFTGLKPRGCQASILWRLKEENSLASSSCWWLPTFLGMWLHHSTVSVVTLPSLFLSGSKRKQGLGPDISLVYYTSPPNCKSRGSRTLAGMSSLLQRAVNKNAWHTVGIHLISVKSIINNRESI